MSITCNKIKYTSSEKAYEDLRRIVENNDYRPWKTMTPHRVYLCDICSSEKESIYHLSSKINLTY